MTITERTLAHFAEFIGAPPDLAIRAPGRVNLIGEHTDYNDGFVLPAAISLQSIVAIRHRPDTIMRIIAADFDNAVSEFDLAHPITHDEIHSWSNYIRGVVAVLQAENVDFSGFDVLVSGDIPQGAGLSSSASISVAAGMAFGELLAPGRFSATDIALIAQRAESDFVGMHCGNMDQLAAMHGQADHALLIDCRSLAVRPIKLPPGAAILIVHSGIRRGLVSGHYNERRRQCERGAQACGTRALRDVTLDHLQEVQAELDPVTYRRARHVITENARTIAAAKAMVEEDLPMLGELMAASHASMRDDFEITLPAIDALVADLQTAIGPHGGARMTGGGFGGAVVAIVRAEAVDTVVRHIEERYRTPNGSKPVIMIERAHNGASFL